MVVCIGKDLEGSDSGALVQFMYLGQYQPWRPSGNYGNPWISSLKIMDSLIEPRTEHPLYTTLSYSVPQRQSLTYSVALRMCLHSYPFPVYPFLAGALARERQVTALFSCFMAVTWMTRSVSGAEPFIQEQHPLTHRQTFINTSLMAVCRSNHN
jgi:hypothetical protein